MKLCLRKGKLVVDVIAKFLIGQTLKMVMNRNPLLERFMNRLFEQMIQTGFPTKNQGKAVQGIKPVVHNHLQIFEDTVIEVLSLVNNQNERLTLFFVEIIDSILNGTEH